MEQSGIVFLNWKFAPTVLFFLALDQADAEKEANLSNTSKVLGVQKDGSVIEEFFVLNKPEQKWEKGPIESNGYFTLKNPLTKKLLTGKSDSVLSVKSGVYFDNKTKEFDFSAAVPQGVKVSQGILYTVRAPL